MLTKLLKYEFKATGRIILPIAGGVLILNLISDIFGRFLANASREIPLVGVFTALLAGLALLGLVAVLFVCFFLGIQRFYKLLGEQGYLLLALPVRPWQHIAAKLICGTVWTLFGVLYCQLCGAFTLSALDNDFSFHLSGPDDLLFALLAVVLVLIFIALAQLHAYLACAFAAQFTQQRLLISIVSYFVLGFIGQALLLVSAVVFFVKGYPYLDDINALVLSVNSMSGGNLLFVILGVLCLGGLVVDAILWALTQWFMTKRLNLA